jgi:4-amino-4-deoxy-L-arabinose transferase-like glycosyltransferase
MTLPPHCAISGSLRALLVGAFCLRLVYVFAVPAWQSADEYPHYWVASSIAGGHGYPPGSPDSPRYEAYQSPLYYILIAGVIEIAGNSSQEYSEILQSPSRLLVMLRLVSAILGVSIVAATWSVTRAMFGDEPIVSLSAAALTAVLPTFVGLSASVNNDILVVFFSSLFLAVILRPYARWTRRSCLGAGILLGAAIASKFTGVLLLLVFAYRLALPRTEDRRWIRRSVLLLLPGLLVGVGVLVLRNVLVYGDPLVITPGVEKGFSISLSQVLRALRNMGWSFWLAFGRTYEIHLSPAAYVIGSGILTGAALFGWWRRRESLDVRRKAWFFIVTGALGILASLAFTLSYPPGIQTSWGKNLYPLLPLFAAFAAFGWKEAFPRFPRLVPWSANALLLAGSVWGLLSLGGS